jgi:hypothetical protein
LSPEIEALRSVTEKLWVSSPLAPALGDERAEIDAELARPVARSKLVSIAPGAIEAGAEQAMAAIGELAEHVELYLGAMCLRWAADHGRVLYRAAIAEAIYAAKAPEAAEKWLSRFPLLTGDKLQ